MSAQAKSPKGKLIIAGIAGVALAAGAAGFWAFGGCDICLAQTIPLAGNVNANCSITVNTLPAAGTLDLTTLAAEHIEVGTVVQNCNKKSGYTITVTSANCASPTPTGAKLYDSVSTELQPYSMEFTNPITGGSSTDVTGLLTSSCAAATGRGVTGAKISGETSHVFVNYTVASTLAAGTYSDTVTVTMNVP